MKRKLPQVNEHDVIEAIKALPAQKNRSKAFGFRKLFSTNPKTKKSDKAGLYLTVIVHLLPGGTCEWASEGCLFGCLHTAGNKCFMPAKQIARRARTELFWTAPNVFFALLVVEMRAFIRKCDKLGRKPAVRLNGTSDLPYEQIAPWLFVMFPEVRFYDYTKGLCRLGKTPSNYWLTFSRSEVNDFEVGVALARGHHVAVVMQGAKRHLPSTWNGYGTENGDKDDLLFLRDNPVQVLYPKGKARQDKTGWVMANPLVQLSVAC